MQPSYDDKGVLPVKEPDIRLPLFFISLSLLFLLIGLLFGVIGSFQYTFPGWLRIQFPFSRVRPLHVSLVISWIFTAASGGIYFYIQDYLKRPLYSIKLAWLHGMMVSVVSIFIILAYSSGSFGGREYLEFPVWIGAPLIIYWLLFMYNFFKTLTISFKKAPIYIWMWATGLVFFLLTFLESQLWLLDFFSENIIRDTTVQWKALGSMVGSWNMLIYGTAFYVMEKISGNSIVTNSRQTFFFYFLGLTNLMFNWGHHTYIVPASPWIRHIAYFISMTELLILWNIIRQWKSSLESAKKAFHLIPVRFLSAADFWIFLNLILAIAMSVPAINYFTHGTHITVAHAMGTTMGINTMILFASLMFIMEKATIVKFKRYIKWFKAGFWLSNLSLVIFWFSLLFVGYMTAISKDNKTHIQILDKLKPSFQLISFSGIILMIGFLLLIFPLLNMGIQKIIRK